jgi:hypothetical protein
MNEYRVHFMRICQKLKFKGLKKTKGSRFVCQTKVKICLTRRLGSYYIIVRLMKLGGKLLGVNNNYY